MICKFNDYFGKDKEKGPWLDVFTPTPTRSGAEKVQKKELFRKNSGKILWDKKEFVTLQSLWELATTFRGKKPL